MSFGKRTLPPCHLPIEADALVALHGLKRRFLHDVRVFERDVGGTLQGCILLAESHMRSQSSFDRIVRERFPRCGIESAADAFGERILSRLLPRASAWLLRLQRHSITNEPVPSAIEPNADHPDFRTQLAYFVASSGLREMHPEQRAAFKVAMRYGNAVTQMTGAQAMAILETPVPAQAFTIANLEHGHRIRWNEHAVSLLLPALIFVGVPVGIGHLLWSAFTAAPQFFPILQPLQHR